MEALLAEIDREPKANHDRGQDPRNFADRQPVLRPRLGRLFDSSDGSGSLGVQGLASPNSAGPVRAVHQRDVDLVLNALKERGRLRTISTPKLLAMEGLEAETVVGTEIGYHATTETTTINQVTQPIMLIEFLRRRNPVEGHHPSSGARRKGHSPTGGSQPDLRAASCSKRL